MDATIGLKVVGKQHITTSSGWRTNGYAKATGGGCVKAAGKTMMITEIVATATTIVALPTFPQESGFSVSNDSYRLSCPVGEWLLLILTTVRSGSSV